MHGPPRVEVAGEIYHALNRGNAQRASSPQDADDEAFERVIDEVL